MGILVLGMFFAGIAASVIAFIVYQQFGIESRPLSYLFAVAGAGSQIVIVFALWPVGVIGEPSGGEWNRVMLCAFLLGCVPAVALVAKLLAERLLLCAIVCLFATQNSFSQSSVDDRLDKKASVVQSTESALQASHSLRPLELYKAANKALVDGREEDAGFLYLVARLRFIHDLLLFPSIKGGSESPERLFESLEHSASAANLLVMSHPGVFEKVVARLERWNPSATTGYTPEWNYNPATDVQGKLAVFHKKKEELIDQLKALSGLLEIPEYLTALTVVVRALDVREQSKLSLQSTSISRAIEVMRTVEEKQGIHGIAAAYKDSESNAKEIEIDF